MLKRLLGFFLSCSPVAVFLPHGVARTRSLPLKRSRERILAPRASIAAYEALSTMPNRAPPEAFQPLDWLVRRACLKAQTEPQLADAIQTAYALGGYHAVWQMLDPLEDAS